MTLLRRPSCGRRRTNRWPRGSSRPRPSPCRSPRVVHREGPARPTARARPPPARSLIRSGRSRAWCRRRRRPRSSAVQAPREAPARRRARGPKAPVPANARRARWAPYLADSTEQRACLTSSIRNGRLRRRTPVAWWTALPMAAAVPTIPSSPIPFTPAGLSWWSTSSTARHRRAPAQALRAAV